MFVVKKEQLYKKKDGTFTLFLDDARIFQKQEKAVAFCKVERGEYLVQRCPVRRHKG